MSLPISRRLRAGFAGALMAGTALSGMILWQGHPANAQNGAISVPAISQPAVALPGFADLAARVRPAVVTITTTERATQVSTNSPFPPGSEQDQLFRRHFGEQPGMRGQPQRPANALGSGFIVDADGTVVTNNHVVRNATTVKVKLDDGRELNARVVGRDERTDIAVLKIDAGQPLPFLALGDSNAARPGDWVVAVGNPFGLGGTVTAGIVSARGRDIGVGPYDDFIQIDAPINSGNSGGPLFGLDGSVIGVNTAIFSPSGGSVGIGFAIPAEVADTVTKQLIRGGRIERGYIGASIQNFTREMADAQGMGEQRGAIVADLVAGGPSARSGLLVGDVVVAINGQSVKNSSELTRRVAQARPGDALRLDIIRNGRRQQVTVRSGTRPSERELAANDNTPGGRTPGAPAPPTQSPPVIGLALAPLDDASRRQLNVPADVRGALVTSVDQASDAAEKGLRRGDVITRAGDRAVTSAADLSAVVDAAKRANRTSVLVGVYRNGRTSFLPLNISG